MNDTVGFVAEPNCGRGTIGILWQCLTTIFLCVYTSFHPRITKARYTRLQHIIGTSVVVCALVVFPELMLLIALGQSSQARDIKKYFARHTNVAVSSKQAHYIAMNGIRPRYQNEEILPRYDARCEGEASIGFENGIYITAADYAASLPCDQDIDDLAKNDLAGKMITIIQAVWTATTIVARAASHYRVSLLELSTCAFILNALLSYMFWISTPYGIKTYHTMTLVATTTRLVPYKSTMPTLAVNEHASAAHNLLDNRNDEVRRLEDDAEQRVQVDAVTVVTDSQRPVGTSLSDLFLVHVANDCFLYTSAVESRTRASAAICMSASALVVASHAAAWNYDFATVTERILWQISVVGIAATAAVMTIAMCIDTWIPTRVFDLQKTRYMLPTLIVYVLARLYIIVEIFLAFRAAPVGIYTKVSWANYVGHVGG